LCFIFLGELSVLAVQIVFAFDFLLENFIYKHGFQEEEEMLEVYCVGLFLILSIGSVWLIDALDKMMGSDS